MPFTLTSEIAQHYLEIIKLLDGQWLLQGPLTSHSWLRLSATPYYFFFSVFALFRFHPLTLNYLWIIASILLIPLNYFVVKKIFNRKTAWISTVLLIVSLLFWNLLKLPSFFNFIIPLSYWLMWVLWKIINNKRPIWLVFLIISLMTTLHAAALMLLPFFIILFLIGSRFNKKQSILSVIAFLIPQVPFFINDYFSKFSMTKSLFLWVPYKAFNFISGKTLGLNKIPVQDQTIQIIFDFINPLFFFALIFYFWKKKTSLFEKIIFSWLIFGLSVLFIHKNPPIHYFVPIAIIPIILVSRFLTLINQNLSKLIVILLVLVNLSTIFQKPKLASDFIPYQTQEKITKTIINDAKGRKFSLSRQGPFDNYTEQFKQNYEYILWWLGNRPLKNAKLNYMIVENINLIVVFQGKKIIYQIR